MLKLEQGFECSERQLACILHSVIKTLTLCGEERFLTTTLAFDYIIVDFCFSVKHLERIYTQIHLYFIFKPQGIFWCYRMF